MNYLQFTDFRNNSKKYFEKVMSGDSYIIIRKGKPVAKIIPFEEKAAGWKRAISKIKLKKNTTSLKYIMQERKEK